MATATVPGSAAAVATAAPSAGQPAEVDRLSREVASLKAALDAAGKRQGEQVTKLGERVARLEARPADAKGADAKSADAKPADAKSADPKPAEAKAPDPKPAVAAAPRVIDPRLPAPTPVVPPVANAAPPAAAPVDLRPASPADGTGATADVAAADPRFQTSRRPPLPVPGGAGGQPAVANRPLAEGWIVIDVNRGRAIVDGRDVGVFEVEAGSTLPGSARSNRSNGVATPGR
jgi:hypothetical protein